MGWGTLVAIYLITSSVREYRQEDVCVLEVVVDKIILNEQPHK